MRTTRSAHATRSTPATRRPPPRSAGATRSGRPPSRPRPAHSARRTPLVPILLGVVVLLGLVVVVASRGGSGDGVAADVQQVRPVSVSGTALRMLEEGADSAVGAAIPEVDGQGFAGDSVAIRRDSTPKLIVFLAHWCPHCRNEVPVITRWLADKGTPEGIDLLSVSTAVSKDRPNYPPSVWLEREDWTLPTLVDDADGKVAQAFGLSAFPFFVAVDANGTVVARGSGELDVEALEEFVDRALSR